MNLLRAADTAQLDSATDPPASSQRHRRGRAKPVLLAVVVTVIVAVSVVAPAGTVTGKGKPGAGVIDNGSSTALVAVSRRNLSGQTNVSATLGYAGSYTVINQLPGTYTALPPVGKAIAQGHVVYRVNGSPVVLLAGSTPMYRTLSEGGSDADVTGTDVAELNADLVTLGYATTAEIPAGSDEFTWQTKRAVEKLQARLRLKQTGTLLLGRAVFLPTALRVTAVSVTSGVPAQPGQPALTGTSTRRDVAIPLDAAQQAQVRVGDEVTVTLPNNHTTPGLVTSIGKVATIPQGGGPATITVHVTPSHPAATGNLDQAPVEVSITTATVSNVLVVPVDALLALAGSGYAVEVDTGGVRHLVQVSLGLFDDADGLVEVTGSGLSAGAQVVVPSL